MSERNNVQANQRDGVKDAGASGSAGKDASAKCLNDSQVSAKELKTLGDPIRGVLKDSQMVVSVTVKQVIDFPGTPPTILPNGTPVKGADARGHYELMTPTQPALKYCLDQMQKPLKALESKVSKTLDAELVEGESKHGKSLTDAEKAKVRESWTMLKHDVEVTRENYAKLKSHLPELAPEKVVSVETRNAIGLANLRILDSMHKAESDYHTLLSDLGVPRLKILAYSLPKDLRLVMEKMSLLRKVPLYVSDQAQKLINAE